MSPEISIIVPIYRVEEYLAHCIESILVQTFADFELLLIDDGSPDNCGHICDMYADNDKRVKVIHKDNRGAASARNVGLSNATGKYILFCDGDDFVEPEWAESLYHSVSNEKAVIGVCGCFLVRSKTDEKEPRLPGTDALIALSSYYDLRLASLDQFVWNKIFIKRIIDEENLCFDITMPYAEDQIFIMNYLRPLNGMIGVCNECLYDYRINPKGISHQYIPQLWDCYQHVFSLREEAFAKWGVDVESNRKHCADNYLKCILFSINNYLSDKSNLNSFQKRQRLKLIVNSRYFSEAVNHSGFEKCNDEEIAALKSQKAGKIYACAMRSRYPDHPSLIFKLGKIQKKGVPALFDKIKNTLKESGFSGLCSKVTGKIKCFFFKILYRLEYRKPIIVLESVPNLSDNTKGVYDELLRRKLNKKYRIVWACWKDGEKKLGPENCETVNFKKDSIRQSARVEAILKSAVCIICCNRFIKPVRSTTKVYYLTHGSPIKSTRSYYTVPDYIDYCISPAAGMNEIISYQFNYALSKVVPLGFPRNDAFADADVNLSDLFPHPYRKIVVWYPTYRQHTKWEARTNSTEAIPILHNADLSIRLNEFAKKLDTLIVLKPHFAQDVSYIKDLKLSNIIFIDDSFFEMHGISSYEFIGSCDALLTDYSSVYFDYLLSDKPIGVIWEDIDAYRENPGFALDLDHYLKGAEKLYTIDNLERFLTNLSNGNDNLAEERREICNEVNYSYDGKNAARVVDFIIKQSELSGTSGISTTQIKKASDN